MNNYDKILLVTMTTIYNRRKLSESERKKNGNPANLKSCHNNK